MRLQLYKDGDVAAHLKVAAFGMLALAASFFWVRGRRTWKQSNMYLSIENDPTDGRHKPWAAKCKLFTKLLRLLRLFCQYIEDVCIKQLYLHHPHLLIICLVKSLFSSIFLVIHVTKTSWIRISIRKRLNVVFIRFNEHNTCLNTLTHSRLLSIFLSTHLFLFEFLAIKIN